MACWYWSVQPRPPLLSSSSSSSLSRTGLSNGQVRLSVLTWANGRGCKGERAVSPAWWGSERTQVIPKYLTTGVTQVLTIRRGWCGQQSSEVSPEPHLPECTWRNPLPLSASCAW